MNKQKTDWYFVTILFCLGLLGLTLVLLARGLNNTSERVDKLEIETIKSEKFPLPQHQTNTPTIFEKMGIDKNGQISE